MKKVSQISSKIKNNYLINKKGKNNGIKLIALIFTIVVFFSFSNKNLIPSAEQTKRAESISEMESDLNAKLEELKNENGNYTTLDDVTLNWLNKKLSKYQPKLIDDLLIAGKIVILKSNGLIGEFELDENLSIISKKITLEDSLRLSYEVKSKEGNDLVTLVTVTDIKNGIDKIEYLNDGIILNCNGKKDVSRDCKIQFGQEYKIKIITKSGEEKIETIIIDRCYYRIKRNLQSGIRLDNKAIKIEEGNTYSSNIIVDGTNTILDEFDVTVGEQKVATNIITAKIEISNVKDDISVTATSKNASIYISDPIIAQSTTATKSVADRSITNGTTLYIRFDATLEGILCTSNPAIPYAITKPGTYQFKLSAIHSGKTITKTYSIQVKKYDVYYIETRTDLENVKNDLTGKYYLMNDIDLSGKNWTPIHRFNGTFDGNGHIISNLYIDGERNAGLFGYCPNKHYIRNLKLENVNITNAGEYAAGLVAQPYYGYYENIAVTGYIQVSTAFSGNCYVGSICAKADYYGTSYKNCYARTTLLSANGRGVGGLVGDQYNRNDATFEKCYWSGTLTAKYIGYGPIIYFGPDKTSTRGKTTVIKNCYYNSDTFSYKANSDPSIGLTTAQFADSSNFNEWDFANEWIIKDGYPELRIFVHE